MIWASFELSHCCVKISSLLQWRPLRSTNFNDDEFVLLYYAYASNLIFPYWKFRKFDLDLSSDVECSIELRFEKQYLQELLTCLGIPEKKSL